MPFDRSRYPSNWEEIVAQVRARANNRCEWPGCGIENGTVVQGKRGPYKIVLTTAHLNHDPSDDRLESLRFWCQKHHLRYDAQHHARTAAQTRRRKQQDAGQLVLLLPQDQEIER